MDRPDLDLNTDSDDPAVEPASSGRGLERLAIFANFAVSFLVASAWILPLFSEFDLIGDHISELVLGRFGLVQALALLLVGFATLGLGYVLMRLTSGTRGATFGSLLISLYGAAGVVSALFPTDEVRGSVAFDSMSMTGLIHSMAALVGFVAVVAGMLILTWRFRELVAWRPILTLSVLHAGGALALLFVQTQGPLVGLMQRLLVTVVGSWLIIVAVRSRQILGEHQP